MPVSLWDTETRYVANQLTIVRGVVGDITSVGVFHSLDPNEVPTPAQFTLVDLIIPPDPLAEGQKIDVLSLIGPDSGGIILAAGAWQRWVLISTLSEQMIFKVDLVTVNS